MGVRLFLGGSAGSIHGEPDDITGDREFTAAHAPSKATVEPYGNIAEAQRRKPSPAMLYEAMRMHGAVLDETIFIGDMQSDHDAAMAAGVAYYDANEVDWRRLAHEV